MNTIRCALSLVCITISATPCTWSQAQEASLLPHLPERLTFEGWSLADSPRIYQGQELYRFIDGGADLFMEYGFHQALSLSYQNIGGSTAELELYEMKDTAAAYGIYSLRSGGEGRPIDIGEEGTSHLHYIMFWKGDYYVSVAGSDTTAECRRGVERIAREVGQSLPSSGREPSMMDLLPKRHLLRHVFVRGYMGLSMIDFSPQSDLFPAAGCAVGLYTDHMLILLSYADDVRSRARMGILISKLTAGREAKGTHAGVEPICTVDAKNRSLCVCHSAPYIIVAVSSDPLAAANSLTEAITSLGAR